MSDAERCSAQAASCSCRHATGHEGPHECEDAERCDGAWTGVEETESFKVVRLPAHWEMPWSLLGGLFHD